VKSQFITISNFESRLGETLLSRGHEYIENVLELKSAGNAEYDQWKAEVQGSEVYRVTIQVERSSGVIRFNSCNCPFDGPICKHQVAVLYTIQMEDDGKSRQPKVKLDKVDDVLSKLSLDELRQYIKERTEEDEDSKKHFLSAFATKTCKTVEDFKGIVEQALRPLKRAHGFVQPQEFIRTLNPVNKLIDNAEGCMHNGDFETGINIYIVSDGHTDYSGVNNYKTTAPAKYTKLTIAETVNSEQFKVDLKEHQQGRTDYLTFIAMCAAFGIEK
jgi:hypothetical protein